MSVSFPGKTGRPTHSWVERYEGVLLEDTWKHDGFWPDWALDIRVESGPHHNLSDPSGNSWLA
jgi:hypothetical protein